MKNIRIFRYLLAVLSVISLHSCLIENDMSYPRVLAEFTAFGVDGQESVTINTQDRTISVVLSETADISALKIMDIGFTDMVICHPMLKPGDIIDLSEPLKVTLSIYQDYEWTVTVEQLIDREIVMENQIGSPVIDVEHRRVIVYVAPDQPLDAIKVTTFNLGGSHGEVYPDPTEASTYDFSQPCTFYVRYSWEEVSYEWKVYVYQQESSGATGDVMARVTTASLSGSIQNGKTPVVE